MSFSLFLICWQVLSLIMLETSCQFQPKRGWESQNTEFLHSSWQSVAQQRKMYESVPTARWMGWIHSLCICLVVKRLDDQYVGTASPARTGKPFSVEITWTNPPVTNSFLIEVSWKIWRNVQTLVLKKAALFHPLKCLFYLWSNLDVNNQFISLLWVNPRSQLSATATHSLCPIPPP